MDPTRRAFVAGSFALLGAPLAAKAQPTGKLPRVGFVRVELPFTAPQREAFLEGLRDRGWNDGRNVAIDWRGRDEEIPDLVRLNVDVMVLTNPYRIEAGLKQTKTIPIVTLDLESDPVGKGFIKSLSRPGGNLTGIWMDFPDIAGKHLQMLKEAVPALSRVAVIWDANVAGAQFAATQTRRASSTSSCNRRRYGRRARLRTSSSARCQPGRKRSSCSRPRSSCAPKVESRNWRFSTASPPSVDSRRFLRTAA